MNQKNLADELREIASRDHYHEKIEGVINGEVNTVLFGIERLARDAAKCGGRRLCGYFDSFYWDGTDYFIRPSMSATGFQRHVLPGSYPKATIPSTKRGALGKRIYYSKSEIAYMHREIKNRLEAKLKESGFSNIVLRIDHKTQKKSDKLFAGKTGDTLYYLWINISW